MSLLLQNVTGFRDGILNGRSSSLMCDAVCLPLQGWLSFAYGVETAIAQKPFKYRKGSIVHMWLELPGGHIIDPTADQLEEYGFPKMPPVYIGEKPSFYP